MRRDLRRRAFLANLAAEIDPELVGGLARLGKGFGAGDPPQPDIDRGEIVIGDHLPSSRPRSAAAFTARVSKAGKPVASSISTRQRRRRGAAGRGHIDAQLAGRLAGLIGQLARPADRGARQLHRHLRRQPFRHPRRRHRLDQMKHIGRPRARNRRSPHRSDARPPARPPRPPPTSGPGPAPAPRRPHRHCRRSR